MNNWQNNSGLCCCEYYDQDQERNHILACCCNCYELDECCDNLICCNSVSMAQTQSVLLRIQDRLRVPWHGGAKQIALDAVTPIILLPTLLILATINFWTSVLVFTIILIIIYTAYKIHLRNSSGTKFFLMWTVVSILLIWFIFEFKVQQLLEITMEENIAFNIMYNCAIFCIYKTRQYATIAKLQRLEQSNAADEERSAEMLIEIEEEAEQLQQPETLCQFCKCRKTDRIVHCYVCHTCVTNQEYHNVWFDCCIGKHNRRVFFFFLLLAVAALLFGSNLTLTTVCNNFVFYKTILMPNDCSDVYDQFDLTICFLIGVYSLMLGLFLLWFFIQQCWFISLGITGNEWRKFSSQNRYGILFLSYRPYSKGFVQNWINFLF